MDYSSDMTTKVQGPMNLSTEHAAAVIVLGALVFIILVRRGFRGVSVGGISAGIK